MVLRQLGYHGQSPCSSVRSGPRRLEPGRGATRYVSAAAAPKSPDSLPEIAHALIPECTIGEPIGPSLDAMDTRRHGRIAPTDMPLGNDLKRVLKPVSQLSTACGPQAFPGRASNRLCLPSERSATSCFSRTFPLPPGATCGAS